MTDIITHSFNDIDEIIALSEDPTHFCTYDKNLNRYHIFETAHGRNTYYDSVSAADPAEFLYKCSRITETDGPIFHFNGCDTSIGGDCFCYENSNTECITDYAFGILEDSTYVLVAF